MSPDDTHNEKPYSLEDFEAETRALLLRKKAEIEWAKEARLDENARAALITILQGVVIFADTTDETILRRERVPCRRSNGGRPQMMEWRTSLI